MTDKNKRIALITGVSRKIGIGAAITRTLAEDGDDVFITYYQSCDHESDLAANPYELQNLPLTLR